MLAKFAEEPNLHMVELRCACLLVIAAFIKKVIDDIVKQLPEQKEVFKLYNLDGGYSTILITFMTIFYFAFRWPKRPSVFHPKLHKT